MSNLYHDWRHQHRSHYEAELSSLKDRFKRGIIGPEAFKALRKELGHRRRVCRRLMWSYMAAMGHVGGVQ